MKISCLAPVLSAIALAFAVPAQAQTAPCTPSKCGPNDQIGALNNITPANVLEASKLIKRGKSIRMGIETNHKTPAYAPRTFSLTVLSPGQENGASLGATKTNYNDDIIMGWVGIGSQLDGLGHIGTANVYYNCNKAGDFVTAGGLKKLGIEKIGTLMTRGILLDIAKLKGVPIRLTAAIGGRGVEQTLTLP